MISGHMFEFLINFKFILLYGIRWLTFIILHVAIHFTNTTDRRDCPFSIVYSWHLCLKLIDQPPIFVQ